MKWLWRALLAASLVGNVLLVLTRDTADPALPAARPARRLMPDRIVPEFPDSDRAAPPRDYQAIERAALEQRLATLEARLDVLRPIVEKFASGTRSLDIETRVKPYLDEVFAQYKVAEPKYRFECRGRVCRVDSDVPEEWTRPLQQTYPTRSLFRTMAFVPEGTFIELAPPDDVPGAFLHGMMMAAFLGARRPCGLAQSPAGDLSIRLDYDAGTRRVTREVAGSLAAQPVGACVTKALDDVIAATTLPPEMTHSQRSGPQSFTLPLDDDD